MNSRNVIPFEPQKRLLQKARAYVEAPTLFLEDGQAAVSLLLKAFRAADSELKLRMIPLLGSAPRTDVAACLYRIMTDAQEAEEVRHSASIQLSVVGSLLEDATTLVDRLLKDLRSPDGQLRGLAAFALGWEGNERAALALVERIYDEDPQVQVTAVNALSNLADDRVFNLLVERLDHAPLEQKRSILFNLWRFSGKCEAVAAVYTDHLRDADDGLRLDALALLDSVGEPQAHLAAYLGCLSDRSPRVRALAVTRLERLADVELGSLKERIAALGTDPDPEVKAAADRILSRLSTVS